MIGVEVLPSQPMMEADLDSLAAVELCRELENRFGVVMPAAVMFDYPTVTSIAKLIANVPAFLESCATPEFAVAGNVDSQMRRAC